MGDEGVALVTSTPTSTTTASTSTSIQEPKIAAENVRRDGNWARWAGLEKCILVVLIKCAWFVDSSNKNRPPSLVGDDTGPRRRKCSCTRILLAHIVKFFAILILLLYLPVGCIVKGIYKENMPGIPGWFWMKGETYSIVVVMDFLIGLVPIVCHVVGFFYIKRGQFTELCNVYPHQALLANALHKRGILALSCAIFFTVVTVVCNTMSFYLTDMFPFYGNWDILDLTISTLCLLSQCFITCTLVQIFGSVCFTHCSELSMWACQLHPPPFEQQMQRYTNIKRKILSSSHTFADWLTFMCVVIGMNTVCAIHGGIYTSQDYYTFALSDFLRILCLPIVFLIIAGHILADAAAVSLSLERAVASLSLVTPPDPASTPQQQATTTTPVLLQRHILFSEQLCKSTFTAFGFPLSSSSLSQCVAGIFALTVLMIVISL